jgi:hypothetical protein
MDERKLVQTREAFPDKHLVVECDRWTSDIQMVHEHYYNLLYGYYNEQAVGEIRKFVTRPDISRYVKRVHDLLPFEPWLALKLGEIGMSESLYRTNLRAVLGGRQQEMKIVDFEYWTGLGAAGGVPTADI